MNKPVVIISCGAQKLDHKAPAAKLYTGPYFRACLRYARSIAPDEDIFILSAKHGLIRLTTEIEPYERTMSKARASSMRNLVSDQARRFDLIGREVIALCGGHYRDLIRWTIGFNAKAPLIGVGGIGKQMAWLKEQTEVHNHAKNRS